MQSVVVYLPSASFEHCYTVCGGFWDQHGHISFSDSVVAERGRAFSAFGLAERVACQSQSRRKESCRSRQSQPGGLHCWRTWCIGRRGNRCSGSWHCSPKSTERARLKCATCGATIFSALQNGLFFSAEWVCAVYNKYDSDAPNFEKT